MGWMGSAPAYDGVSRARLPEDRLERTISSLREGESAWVVPWAMTVDSNRRCALKASYGISDRPGGTVSMRIERGAEGFHVWLPEDATWSVGEATDGLPVIALHEGER
jgi:hypothetical protein